MEPKRARESQREPKRAKESQRERESQRARESLRDLSLSLTITEIFLYFVLINYLTPLLFHAHYLNF